MPRGVADTAVTLAFAVGVLSVGVAGQDGGIFTPLDPARVANQAAEVASDGVTLRRRLITVDIEQLAEARAATVGRTEPSVTLQLNLFADAVLRGIVEGTTPTPAGYALSGRIEGVEAGSLTVVVNGDVVAGTIRTPQATYRIRPAGPGVHAVSQVDTSRLPPGAEPLVPPAGDGPQPKQKSGQSWDTGVPVSLPPNGGTGVDRSNGESVIDLAVFYTPAARQAEGGTGTIEAVIDLMIAETNQAYAEGGVNQRAVLAVRAETQYTESAFPSLDLDRFTDPADGYMDEIHTLRNRARADVVHLITRWDFESTGVCGIAWIMRNVSAGFSSFAFGTTHHLCGGRTFAHELGHNMGLAHDRYVACNERGCSGAAYPYGYGYVNQRAFDAGAPASARWRTIMAYDRQCDDAGFDCEGPLRFSNPTQVYAGDPLGVSGDAASTSPSGPSDTVRSLNNVRTTVENFRRSTDVDFPELVVGLASVNDRTTTPGRAVTLTATVRNHGTRTAPPVQVRLYQDGSPVAIRTASVGFILPGDAQVRQFDLTAPSIQGGHFYRAAVDVVSNELDNNNFSSWVGVPVIVPSCITSLGSVSGVVTRTGSWDGSCLSAYYSFGEYARYYSFTLGQPRQVTIDLSSPSVDTWLVLRNSAGLRVVNDDGGEGTNSRISRALEAGTYTIEATTYAPGSTGPFTLTIRADSASMMMDREALEALYHATDGPNWTNNSNWLSNAPLEDWFGVDTDGSGRVTALSLHQNQLSGSIPAELGRLALLEHLGLAENQLNGPIPAELGGLANLEWLLLWRNALSGSIPPALGNLANLKTLDLSINALSGSIPAALAARGRSLFAECRCSGCLAMSD